MNGSRVFRCAGLSLLLLFSTVLQAQFSPFQPLPDQPPVPDDNPMTAAKVELGKQLFFDPRLSVNRSISCNSCHNVMGDGADDRPLSVGATGKMTKRNAISLWNVAYNTIFFWDGAALSLEGAIHTHITDVTTMAMPDQDTVTKRIAQVAGYQHSFQKVYGDDGVNYDNIVKSLATYLRTFKTQDSLFDQHLRGNTSALSDAAKRGFHQYVEIGCASCHFWVNMAGPVPGVAFQVGEGFYELFPNHTGSKYDAMYGLTDDIGRYQVMGDETDKLMWRVSSLRNVALTGPYFHNGSVDELDEAIRVMAKVQLRYELAEDIVRDIAAFLETLSGEFPEQTMPRLPD